MTKTPIAAECRVGDVLEFEAIVKSKTGTVQSETDVACIAQAPGDVDPQDLTLEDDVFALEPDMPGTWLLSFRTTSPVKAIEEVYVRVDMPEVDWTL